MIRPFGETAFLVELDGPERAQAVAAALRTDRISGSAEVVAGLASVLVEIDPAVASPHEVLGSLQRAAAAAVDRPPPGGRPRTIPVIYGGEHGPDLVEVAEACGLSEEEVVARHASSHLRVLFNGFAPGFAYLGLLPSELRVSRLATPRTRTPAGSVAIAESMSGIYPADLPGGWRVIGRTPITLFDPRRDPPTYLAPADTVRFEPIDDAEWAARAGVPGDW